MKTLNELHQWMEDNEYFELANELAITRYKANMWDKYNREARIHKDLVQALEITETVHDARRIFEENREELKEFDSIKNPHAHDNFPQMKDASGATYTGHNEEDIPGTARKGEN